MHRVMGLLFPHGKEYASIGRTVVLSAVSGICAVSDFGDEDMPVLDHRGVVFGADMAVEAADAPQIGDFVQAREIVDGAPLFKLDLELGILGVSHDCLRDRQLGLEPSMGCNPMPGSFCCGV